MSSGAPDGRTWRERAQRAEELGFSTLFMPDHFEDQWSPIVGLTVAAEATGKLLIGSLVLDNDYRHPVVLAKEAASLDLASEGRLELGLGAGWMRRDYEQAGITYDPPAGRISRMEEGLAVMKGLWSSAEPFSFHGSHYDIDGAVGTPRPHRSPHPRICIGGGGKRMLSVAAREADIVGVNANLRAGEVGPDAAATSTAAAFDNKITWIREAAGDRFEDLELQCHTALAMIVPNRAEIAAGMAPAFGISVEDALEVPLVLVGTVEEICEDLERRRQRYGLSYWVVPDASMEDFAPVVSQMSGR